MPAQIEPIWMLKRRSERFCPATQAVRREWAVLL
jgi:hypothetical protein